MFIVNSYSLAIIFCFITMLSWGSWGNTQKLAGKTWRYELFYWDYVIGILLFSLISAFTLGSIGSEGRSFLDDLAQAEWSNIGSAFLGGHNLQCGQYSSFCRDCHRRPFRGLPSRCWAGPCFRSDHQLCRPENR